MRKFPGDALGISFKTLLEILTDITPEPMLCHFPEIFQEIPLCITAEGSIIQGFVQKFL